MSWTGMCGHFFFVKHEDVGGRVDYLGGAGGDVEADLMEIDVHAVWANEVTHSGGDRRRCSPANEGDYVRTCGAGDEGQDFVEGTDAVGRSEFDGDAHILKNN